MFTIPPNTSWEKDSEAIGWTPENQTRKGEGFQRENRRVRGLSFLLIFKRFRFAAHTTTSGVPWMIPAGPSMKMWGWNFGVIATPLIVHTCSEVVCCSASGRRSRIRLKCDHTTTEPEPWDPRSYKSGFRNRTRKLTKSQNGIWQPSAGGFRSGRSP